MSRTIFTDRRSWFGAVSLSAVLLINANGLAEEGESSATLQHSQVCNREQFAAVVDAAAASLRALNQNNRPLFQAKLAQLQQLKGWDHQAFLKQAEPFVRDDKIDTLDRKINTHLRQISQMGDAGSAAKSPDCGMLSQLRGHMGELVRTQKAKWAYMLEKLEKAIEGAS
jgi:hypothetical protein